MVSVFVQPMSSSSDSEPVVDHQPDDVDVTVIVGDGVISTVVNSDSREDVRDPVLETEHRRAKWLQLVIDLGMIATNLGDGDLTRYLTAEALMNWEIK